jgi:hypothetical protein
LDGVYTVVSSSPSIWKRKPCSQPWFQWAL